MGDISIPGISDKYKTNEIVKSLMAVEKIPLTREQKTLDTYKDQEKAWQDIDKKLTSLQTSIKTLYSFDNPFDNKLSSSSNEDAVTAVANRDAEYGSFKINIKHPATTDRFLSAELDKNMKVPTGNYVFSVGGKSIKMHWTGGKLTDFVKGLNRRGNKVVKASVIGVNEGKSSLLIQSLVTGKDNKLQFIDDAKKFAIDIGMIGPAKSAHFTFGTSKSEIKTPPLDSLEQAQTNMPNISSSKVIIKNGVITIPPRGGAEIKVPANVTSSNDMTIEFDFTQNQIEDITTNINKQFSKPAIPSAGEIQYKDIIIQNEKSDPLLPDNLEVPKTRLFPINSKNVLYAKTSDGKEIKLDPSSYKTDKNGKTHVVLSTKDIPNLSSIFVRNENTGKQFTISGFSAYKTNSKLGYEPKHAISTAQDALFEYDGIKITRPTNDIDDVVPNITLHLHAKTEKPATIDIKPDTKSAKDSLITFVGKYNQAIAEINILTQKKPELISELDYLSDDEQKSETKKLGMFMSDFSLVNAKSSLQNIMSANYRFDDKATITMLSQIGISTNASGGSSGYQESRLRGYLEINEKKLDDVLANNLTDVKKIFGYDSDGDLIIDSGIGYKSNNILKAYVSTGGIIATRTASLDSKIKTSKKKIAELQTQLDDKESDLKSKYGQMESSLNSLQSQQDAINNFSKQNSSN